MELPLDGDWLSEVFEGTGLRPTASVLGAARVRLDLDGKNVLLTGDFEAFAVASCVACLEDVEIRLAAPFTLHLEPSSPSVNVPTSSRRAEEVELTADDVDADTYSDNKIDLSHWLREQVLLEAPVHPRHEGECPTALVHPAPADGGQRGIDPRFAPLLALVRPPPKE